MQKYRVVLFISGNQKPVETFILQLQPSTRSKLKRLRFYLELHGATIGMPYVRQIMKNLYELRLKGQEEARFFFTVKQNEITILHGFKKKTNKIPRKEIETAIKRSAMI